MQVERLCDILMKDRMNCEDEDFAKLWIRYRELKIGCMLRMKKKRIMIKRSAVAMQVHYLCLESLAADIVFLEDLLEEVFES